MKISIEATAKMMICQVRLAPRLAASAEKPAPMAKHIAPKVAEQISKMISTIAAISQIW